MSLCADCGAEMGSGFADSHRYHHQKWLEGVPLVEPEEKVPYLDLRDPTAIQLERIANALEEQNRFNREWLKQNKTWQKENRDISSRLLALHEGNARREQSHREKMQHIAEEQARQTNDIIQVSYEAYLETLKNPSRELVQAVVEALTNDMRRSTEIRAREEAKQ